MEARDVTLQVRVTRAGAEAMDKKRGSWSRSEYVRNALALAVKSNVRGPEPKQPEVF